MLGVFLDLFVMSAICILVVGQKEIFNNIQSLWKALVAMGIGIWIIDFAIALLPLFVCIALKVIWMVLILYKVLYVPSKKGIIVAAIFVAYKVFLLLIFG